MDKEQAFIVSDIHGCFAEFLEITSNHWDRDKQLLIINGDLVDRGYASDVVMILTYKLVTSGLAVVNWGNHDRMLYDFLECDPDSHPDEFWDMYNVWYRQGGRETSASILSLPSGNVDAMSSVRLQTELKKHEYVKDLMGLMNWYYEFGDSIVVHAGIPYSHQEHYQQTPKLDFIWERGFHNLPNQTGKTIISGHTPARFIHDTDDVWHNEAKDIYMIDGGCAYNGQLNGVVIDLKGNVIETHNVPAVTRKQD